MATYRSSLIDRAVYKGEELQAIYIGSQRFWPYYEGEGTTGEEGGHKPISSVSIETFRCDTVPWEGGNALDYVDLSYTIHFTDGTESHTNGSVLFEYEDDIIDVPENNTTSIVNRGTLKVTVAAAYRDKTYFDTASCNIFQLANGNSITGILLNSFKVNDVPSSGANIEDYVEVDYDVIHADGTVSKTGATIILSGMTTVAPSFDTERHFVGLTFLKLYIYDAISDEEYYSRELFADVYQKGFVNTIISISIDDAAFPDISYKGGTVAAGDVAYTVTYGDGSKRNQSDPDIASKVTITYSDGVSAEATTSVTRQLKGTIRVTVTLTDNDEEFKDSKVFNIYQLPYLAGATTKRYGLIKEGTYFILEENPRRYRNYKLTTSHYSTNAKQLLGQSDSATLVDYPSYWRVYREGNETHFNFGIVSNLVTGYVTYITLADYHFEDTSLSYLFSFNWNTDYSNKIVINALSEKFGFVGTNTNRYSSFYESIDYNTTKKWVLGPSALRFLNFKIWETDMYGSTGNLLHDYVPAVDYKGEGCIVCQVCGDIIYPTKGSMTATNEAPDAVVYPVSCSDDVLNVYIPYDYTISGNLMSYQACNYTINYSDGTTKTFSSNDVNDFTCSVRNDYQPGYNNPNITDETQFIGWEWVTVSYAYDGFTNGTIKRQIYRLANPEAERYLVSLEGIDKQIDLEASYSGTIYYKQHWSFKATFSNSDEEIWDYDDLIENDITCYIEYDQFVTIGANTINEALVYSSRLRLDNSYAWTSSTITIVQAAYEGGGEEEPEPEYKEWFTLNVWKNSNRSIKEYTDASKRGTAIVAEFKLKSLPTSVINRIGIGGALWASTSTRNLYIDIVYNDGMYVTVGTARTLVLRWEDINTRDVYRVEAVSTYCAVSINGSRISYPITPVTLSSNSYKIYVGAINSYGSSSYGNATDRIKFREFSIYDDDVLVYSMKADHNNILNMLTGEQYDGTLYAS